MIPPDPSIPNRLHDASAGTGDQPGGTGISRRAFLALAGGLTASCASRSNSIIRGDQGPVVYDPVTGRPIPRNPSMHLRSEFSLHNQDITYTRADVTEKYVAMTFDDGPHPENTPRLLDMLRDRNIKATFYVIGRSVEAHPQVLQRTVEEGHEIGNHTQTHRLLTKLDDGAVRWELDSCRDAILRATGYRPKTMRPPYGGLYQRQRQLAYLEYGYPTILWSVDPLDWQRPGPSVVASRILTHTRPGSIILSHDLHAPTVDAMPSTLDELLYRGYKFVTVSQLLAMQTELANSRAETSSLNS